MKRLLPILFILSLSMFNVGSVYAQRNKDKILMPQYPGGEAELHKFIMSELQYPLEARVNKESGEVLVAFSVGMDGYISGVRVVRSVSESLDAEAVRVVSKMHPWIPGKKNGRNVRAEMSIPIKFSVTYDNKYINDADDSEKADKKKFRY